MNQQHHTDDDGIIVEDNDGVERKYTLYSTGQGSAKVKHRFRRSNLPWLAVILGIVVIAGAYIVIDWSLTCAH